MRLLVVEDDRQLLWRLERNLRSRYIVDCATTGEDGLFQAANYDYDAILLDLALPDLFGATVCRTLRQQGSDVPIIIMTGQVDPALPAELLDAGADDYVAKPFRFAELHARLRAVMRRAQSRSAQSILRAGDLELDTARRIVRRRNQELSLRRKEFDLLEYFMYNQSQTLTRTMIIEHVWNSGEDLWGNVVDVHVKHLRDVIDRPFASNLIKTVRGIGYKLETEAGTGAPVGPVRPLPGTPDTAQFA